MGTPIARGHQSRLTIAAPFKDSCRVDAERALTNQECQITTQRMQGRSDHSRKLRADFREGDEDSNFSFFRVWRFTESPRPLH